ncbi:MAG TPA: hypothetical protein VK871_08605 [Candidatus Limnocylindrales bacterium]|nr:hypothetical protein [Candidatus Limnocylindrales bacterium]
MTKRPAGLVLAAIALIGLLAACNSAASSGSPSSAASVPASQAASEAPSEAPSNEPSEATSAEPSFAFPSFQLPSNAKDLEALLPAELCGATAQKFSLAGADFESMADEEFAKTLSGLGKSASDVSMAIAAPLAGSECGAGVFRIAGADTGRLQEVFVQAAEDEGSTATSTTLGDKGVVILTTSGETAKQYVYFAGDAIFFAVAPDDAAAAGILSAMP